MNMELGSAIGEDQVKEAKSKQWSEEEKLKKRRVKAVKRARLH